MCGAGGACKTTRFGQRVVYSHCISCLACLLQRKAPVKIFFFLIFALHCPFVPCDAQPCTSICDPQRGVRS